jgi:hypothetical protein
MQLLKCGGRGKNLKEKFDARIPLLVLKTWSPPQSPLCVEYPEEMLRELEPDPARIETTGFLYGRRDGAVVRLRSLPGDEPPVGIYVLRLRGEVFLSEANLVLFEKSRALVALVIAGAKGGFFIRDSVGSIQSVRSYEEFAVPQQHKKRGKAAFAAGLILLATIPVVALPHLHQFPHTGLSIQENGDLLLISWKPGRPGLLEIADGPVHTAIPISAEQHRVDYVRLGGDVQVKLTLRCGFVPCR